MPKTGKLVSDIMDLIIVPEYSLVAAGSPGPLDKRIPFGLRVSISLNEKSAGTIIISNPYDAKGLLISSIRDNDPVIFCEHKALLGMDGEVPDESYEVPLGRGKILKEGNDITIVAIGQMVGVVQNCIKSLEQKGLIAGYTAIIDEVSYGYPVTAFVSVRLENQTDQILKSFEKEITSLDAVMDCWLVTGNRDYLLRVVASDLKNYEIFMREELTKVKGIASIETNFALGRVKTKNNLPLNS